jgi:hypothetical protein
MPFFGAVTEARVRNQSGIANEGMGTGASTGIDSMTSVNFPDRGREACWFFH